MPGLQTALLVLASLLPATRAKVATCKMCTSEDGSNAACEEGAADLPHGECSAAYGDDFCAVLVTKNKGSEESEQWWRGCCSLAPGSNTCPIKWDGHDSNSAWERWRAKCDTDDCNIMNPKDGNNDGGNNDGGVVVHGRSKAVPLLAGTASILCLVLSRAVR